MKPTIQSRQSSFSNCSLLRQLASAVIGLWVLHGESWEELGFCFTKLQTWVLSLTSSGAVWKKLHDTSGLLSCIINKKKYIRLNAEDFGWQRDYYGPSANLVNATFDYTDRISNGKASYFQLSSRLWASDRRIHLTVMRMGCNDEM